MALFIRQNEDRSKLQERLAAELSERAKKRSELENTTGDDLVENSQYLKNTKQTTGLAWAWVLIFFFAAVATIGIVIYSQQV
ncbi:hypothetical protein B7Z28_02135 [Candidatus Saccharibacteria bacterium 32-45-3]|nr:MAG: hypothetical protein B7Z28_02135 [Candidatus Saccharibacteria bacterium 32-45-3]